MLNINKLSIQVAVHELAVANHVTDEQMASYIFRNFYQPPEVPLSWVWALLAL